MRWVVIVAALVLLGCESRPMCLKVPGEAPRTVYAIFPPDRGCFQYWPTREGHADSICGSFSVIGDACPVAR